MSILIPVVDTGVTLNEAPHHVSFFIELGECQAHCKGCHSPHLANHVENKTTLEDLVAKADTAMDKGCNAIVLMGGTTHGISDDDLITIINELAGVAPLCLYSGSDDYEHDIYIANHSMLTWLKTGGYKESLGGLNNPTTNQKFLKKEYKTTITGFTNVDISHEWLDLTEEFQHERTTSRSDT